MTATLPSRRSGLLRPPPVVFAALCLLGLLLLAALLAPALAPYEVTTQNLRMRLQPPGTEGYPLGTDSIGRDTYSRTLFGLRISLLVALLGTAIGALTGTLLGLVAGIGGAWFDRVISFLIDLQLAVPFTLLALTAIAVFGSELRILIPVVGLSGWAGYARITRGQVLVAREAQYFEAAGALGASFPRRALRHLLPNIVSPLIVLATATFSSIMLLESAMSFLGLGVQPPAASLGTLIGNGRDYLINAWWIAVVPSVVLVILTMTSSVIGDWLRDTLDPALRRT